MGQSNWVHLDVTLIKRETEQAFLLVLEDGNETWIPKSQMSDPEDYAEGDTDCTVSITEWIAEQKDLG